MALSKFNRGRTNIKTKFIAFLETLMIILIIIAIIIIIIIIKVLIIITCSFIWVEKFLLTALTLSSRRISRPAPFETSYFIGPLKILGIGALLCDNP